jgi:hypothetical protein
MLRIKIAILFHSMMQVMVYYLISLLSVVFMLGFTEELTSWGYFKGSAFEKSYILVFMVLLAISLVLGWFAARLYDKLVAYFRGKFLDNLCDLGYLTKEIIEEVICEDIEKQLQEGDWYLLPEHLGRSYLFFRGDKTVNLRYLFKKHPDSKQVKMQTSKYVLTDLSVGRFDGLETLCEFGEWSSLKFI